MEIGDGVLGTLSIFGSMHRRGAPRIAALTPGRRVCPDFDIARPSTSCERRSACTGLHLPKCMADKTSWGGGGCPHNSTAGCTFDAEGRITAPGPKTCLAYHFRPTQVSGVGGGGVACAMWHAPVSHAGFHNCGWGGRDVS